MHQAGRIITGDSYDSSATNTRLELGWKDLNTIRDEKLLRLVKKILPGKSDLDIVGLFSLNNREVYNLNTEERIKGNHPRFLTNKHANFKLSPGSKTTH